MNETLSNLDHLELHLSSGNLVVLNIILGFIMFGVALGIDHHDFLLVIKRPKAVFIGLAGQIVLLPLLTIGIIALLGSQISTGMAMGMILVASCPGGNISNFMVHLARGNTALSVSLTAFSTIGSILITPLNFILWGSIYSSYLSQEVSPLLRELNIDVLEVTKTILLLLGLPLLLGMSFARWQPLLKKKIEGPIRIISILAFIGIVAIAFIKNSDAFIEYIGVIFMVVLIHNALAIGVGYQWAKLTGLDQRDRRSVALEMGIQNSGLGLLLLLNPSLFPAELPIGGMAAITAWWGIWHIVAGLSLASYWRIQRITSAS